MRMNEPMTAIRNGLAICVAALMIIAVAGCGHKTATDYLREGDAALQSTHTADAEQAYSAAEKLAPNDPRVHIAMGNLYVFEHKPGPAQIEFMKVIELDPKNPPAHVALGNLYLNQNQERLAEEQYRAAIALDASRGNYHLLLAEALRKEGRLTDAESEIRTALGLNPRDAQAHLALANLLQTEPGRQSEAEAEMAAARAIDPKLAVEAASTPAAAPVTASAAPPAHPAIKPLNKLFLLTKSSSVYQNPDTSSAVLAHVRRKKYVHVTGISGNYLRIKLRNGTVGFIPTTAAE